MNQKLLALMTVTVVSTVQTIQAKSDSLFFFLPAEHEQYINVDSIGKKFDSLTALVNKLELSIIKNKECRNSSDPQDKGQYVDWAVKNKQFDSSTALNYFSLMLQQRKERFEMLNIFLNVLDSENGQKTLCYRLWMAERARINLVSSFVDKWTPVEIVEIIQTGRHQLEME
jgi:hypothetical protein